MNGRAFTWVFLVFFVAFLAFLSGIATAQYPPQNANELVRQVINNELKVGEWDHSRWMYRLETQKPNGSREVDEVVETRLGNLIQPILIDGHEPSAEERQRSEGYIQEVMRNPNELQKSQKQGREDQERTVRILKMLPDAFNYSYAEDRGDLVKLTFVSNAQFHPSGKEAQVFQALEGYMWVNRKEGRLAEIAGHLVREVKFLGGLLGHLDQGGSFDVKQDEVASRCWKITLLNINMTGKALFFKTISAHENDRKFDFKRVSNNLTLAEAADILEKQVNTQLRASNQNQAAARTGNHR